MDETAPLMDGEPERPSMDIDVTDEVLWGVLESAPDGILMVDEQGVIVLVNRQTEVVFGYERHELLGSSVEQLLPERLRRVHGVHRDRYRADPRVRPMGHGMELRGRRRGGVEFDVEISLSPLRAGARTLTIATVRDVTDRTEAEARVRRVQAILDAVREGVFIFDVESLRFTHVNQGAVAQTGYSRSELLTLTPLHIAPELSERRFRELVAPLVADEEASVTVETVHRRADGTDVPVEIVLQRPFSQPEGPRSFVALARDITERVEAESQVRRVQRMLDALSDAVYICDAGTLEFLYVNQGAVEQLGYSRDALLSMSLRDVVAGNTLDPLGAPLASLADGTRSAVTFEMVHRRADASEFPVEVLLQRPFQAEHDLDWLVAVVRDVSERVKTEHELRSARQELALTDDRERIARDLHDTVIQQLFALGMSLQAVAQRVEPRGAAQRVQATIDGLDTAIRDLRSVIFGLQPRPEWGGQGLRTGVLRLAVDASRSLGFEPDVTFAGPVDDVDLHVSEQLLPTLREALSNAARHAHADCVEVDVTVSDDQVVLRVVDDGRGLPPDVGARGGSGLRNMRGRAEGLGGTLQTAAGPRGGTITEWRVPLRAPAGTGDR